jgi:AhpD family alkylhydroperoxidase
MMAWIDLIDPEKATDDVAASFATGRAAYGQVLQTWRAIAHNPPVLAAYLPFVRAVFADGPLDRRIKGLVAIRVSWLNGCRYSVSHRVAAARSAGLPETQILGVASPSAEVFSPADLAALCLADELTIGPASTPVGVAPQAVSPEALAEVRRWFSDPEANDLALTVAVWNMLSRYHRLMAFDLDMAPPPPVLDPR